jgi:hypothetical protein
LATVDFSHIRSTPKSKNESFESLSIQLFKSHCKAPKDSSFFSLRGDGGDGGVEAYYKSTTGEILGIQAKYFFRLGSGEFGQIKKSLMTALKNHPLLTQYWIYIPFDLTGRVAEGKRGKSEVEKFEEWKIDIEQQYPQLKINLLTAELIRQQILEIDGTGGFSTYWFDNSVLTNSKMERCIETAAAFAGPRYCSDLDITTEAHDSLDAFGEIYNFDEWNINLWKPDAIQLRRIALEADKIFALFPNDKQTEATALLNKLLDITSFKKDINDNSVVDSILLSIQELRPYCIDAVELQEEKFFKKYGDNSDTPSFRQFQAEYMCVFPAANLDYSRELVEQLDKIEGILNSPLIQAYHANSFLLTGPAGSGKTHSIVSFAKRRLTKGGYSLVLFGEDFDNAEPWEVIRNKLGFGCDIGRDKLLDCLQASAQRNDKSFIIIIDALNESAKIKKWKNKLPEIIQQCKGHDRIKIAVSTRDIYSNLVVDERFPGYAYNHIGFTRNFHEVLSSFSKRYDIENEITPLFTDELRNPLLLHLIFKTHKAESTQFIDISSEGFTALFDKHLKHINGALRDRLDYVNPKNLVKSSMLALANSMAESPNQPVNWASAVNCLKCIIGEELSSEKFINELINEQLLIISATEDDDFIIRFGYQRFGDVLRATSLIESCKIDGEFEIAELSNKVAKFTCENQGVIEALASCLPEQVAVEITHPELNIDPDLSYKYFINSLTWRSRKSINYSIEEHIHSALRVGGLWQDVFENLFKVFLIPDHYLNASNWFKEFQWHQSSLSRDTYLSIALSDSYDKKGAIWLLIELTSNIEESHWPKESYNLAASALLWCCSATDRRVRDQATRSLTLLFKNHPYTFDYAVQIFDGCNDDYIQESLIIAIYSATLISQHSLEEIIFPLNIYIHCNQETSNILIREHTTLLMQLLDRQGYDISSITKQFVNHAIPKTWPVLDDVQDLLSLEKLPSSMKLWGDSLAPDFWRYIVESKLRNFDLKSLGITNENIACWIMNQALELGYPGYQNQALGHDLATLYKYGTGRAKPGYAETIGKKCYWIAVHRLIGLLSNNVPVTKSKWEPQLKSTRLWSLGLRKLDTTDIRELMFNDIYPVANNFNQIKKFETNDIDNWLEIDDLYLAENTIILKDEDMIEWVNLSFSSDSNTKLDEDDVSYNSSNLYGLVSYSGYFVDAAHISSFEPYNHSSNHCYQIYFGEYPHSPALDQCIVEQDTVISDDIREFGCIELLRGGEWEYDYSSNDKQSSIIMPSPNIIQTMGLVWDNNNGWLDKDNKLATLSFSGKTDSGLFIRKDILDQFLLLTGKSLVIAKFMRKQFSEGFASDAKLVEISSRYSYSQNEGLKLENSEKEKLGFPDK